MANLPPTVACVATPSPPAWMRLTILLVAAQCLALLLLGVMLLNKHHGLAQDLILSRIEIQAGELETALRTAVLTGLRPEEVHSLPAMVQRIRHADVAIAAIEVIATDGAGYRIVFASGAANAGRVVSGSEWRHMTAVRGFVHEQTASGSVIAATIRDVADEAMAVLRIRVATDFLRHEEEKVSRALWLRIGMATVAMTLATLVLLAGLRTAGTGGAALRYRVMTLALVATLSAGGYVAWYAKGLFEAGLTPVLTSKTAIVADLLAGKLVRAEALGIPLDKLPRVNEYFADLIVQHPEVAAIRLNNEVGAQLAGHGIASLPWIERTAGNGRIAVSADGDLVARRMGELALDVGIVLLVTAVVFRELLSALIVTLPGGGTAMVERVQALRLPLFIFILTEEMSRAFMPLFIQSLAIDESYLGNETQVGLPIAIYMLFFALTTPFAGRWADRWGGARVFAAGAGLTLAGFLWMALASSYWELLPARALCACGYATGTMVCQRQLIMFTRQSERARGLGLFIGAIGMAAICGSALGGVLAVQFGFRPVFLVSALLALLALGIFHLSQGKEKTNDHAQAVPLLSFAEIRRLLGNQRFSALMLGGAIPAKIALAGFLFYLVPLALHQFDYSPAAIGRAVMVYFVLVAAINPLASWLSDRRGWRWSLTLAGGAVIGLGGLFGLGTWLFEEIHTEWWIWAGILTLGIGTGLASAPMQALATEIGARTGADSNVSSPATSVAVILRTLERLGSVIGPLWAGVWLATTGWGGAMAAIGLVVLSGTLLCHVARAESRS